MDPRNFFAELKRRNVYRVAVAYAVVAWLLIQIATQVFPFFEIPNWAVRLVVLLLVLGFPIALILAWAFELTPGRDSVNGQLQERRPAAKSNAAAGLLELDWARGGRGPVPEPSFSSSRARCSRSGQRSGAPRSRGIAV